MAVEGVDAAVDLGEGDDEGWGDDEVGDPGLEDDAVGEALGGDLIDEERGAGDLVGVGVEGLFGGAVFDELDGPEEAFAADVADGGVAGFEGLEFLLDVGGELGGALDEVEALHFVDGGDGGGEGHGVGFVGVAVGEVVVLESSARSFRWWRRGRAGRRRR